MIWVRDPSGKLTRIGEEARSTNTRALPLRLIRQGSIAGVRIEGREKLNRGKDIEAGP